MDGRPVDEQARIVSNGDVAGEGFDPAQPTAPAQNPFAFLDGLLPETLARVQVGPSVTRANQVRAAEPSHEARPTHGLGADQVDENEIAAPESPDPAQGQGWLGSAENAPLANPTEHVLFSRAEEDTGFVKENANEMVPALEQEHATEQRAVDAPALFAFVEGGPLAANPIADVRPFLPNELHTNDNVPDFEVDGLGEAPLNASSRFDDNYVDDAPIALVEDMAPANGTLPGAGQPITDEPEG